MKIVPPVNPRRNFFRVALQMMLRPLNCLARDLPGSLRCNGEVLFWDLYPILCLEKSCHILLNGGRVERETNWPHIGSCCQRERQCKSVCDQVAQSWCLLLITLNSYLGLLPYLIYLQSYYILLKTFLLKNFMLIIRVHDGAEPEFAVLIFFFFPRNTHFNELKKLVQIWLQK